jgi:hypothetical protein
MNKMDEEVHNLKQAALLLRAQVFIKKTNERDANVVEYAVCLKVEPDFWLEVFTRKKEAKHYVRDNNLTLVKED